MISSWYWTSALKLPTSSVQQLMLFYLRNVLLRAFGGGGKRWTHFREAGKARWECRMYSTKIVYLEIQKGKQIWKKSKYYHNVSSKSFTIEIAQTHPWFFYLWDSFPPIFRQYCLSHVFRGGALNFWFWVKGSFFLVGRSLSVRCT